MEDATKEKTAQETIDRVVNEPLAKQAEDYMTEKLYIKKTDPTEDEVNVILRLGYTLVSVSTISQEFVKNGIYKSIESQLVYHFLLKGAKK